MSLPEEQEQPIPATDGGAAPVPVRSTEQLMARALVQMRDGTLPGAVPTEVLAGAGQDQPCVLCGEKIPANTFEYEVKIGVDGSARLVSFHMTCYRVWTLAIRFQGGNGAQRSA